MKKKMGQIIVGIIIALSIIIIIGGIWGHRKRSWEESVKGYGPLNMMELDPNAETNDTCIIFSLDFKKDFRIEGNFTIKSGPVKVIASLNGNVLFEDELSGGEATFKSQTFTEQEGEIRVYIIIPDDADGDYTVTIYTQETNLSWLLGKLKESL